MKSSETTSRQKHHTKMEHDVNARRVPKPQTDKKTSNEDGTASKESQMMKINDSWRAMQSLFD